MLAVAEFKVSPAFEESEGSDAHCRNKHGKEIDHRKDNKLIAPRKHAHIAEQEQAEYDERGYEITLMPHTANTDGFYIAAVERVKADD